MKCRDCGAPDYKPSSRGDVCVSCFELRGQVIAQLGKAIQMDEFKELQRVIQRGDGQAANAMRRCLGQTAPEI